ncbi:hypothetical protein BB560_000279 [Smittium megazygosporum]|uniref:Uncharacterized protein n=1 Tax=Smittium megazygosporum TaxID=133381 RepID=A0A2T9ZKT9_9FUNG|nr:hypothetical protein BB560_000279 [Smittium megazygosporum]
MLLLFPEQLIIRIFTLSKNDGFRFVNKAIFKATGVKLISHKNLFEKIRNKYIFEANQEGLLYERFLDETNIFDITNIDVFDYESYNSVFRHAFKKKLPVNNVKNSLKKIIDINVDNGINIVSATENGSFDTLLSILKAYIWKQFNEKKRIWINIKSCGKPQTKHLKKERIYMLIGLSRMDCTELLLSEAEYSQLLNRGVIKGLSHGETSALKKVLSSKIGHSGMVKYLIEKDANIHSDNDYALRWASAKGHLDIVKLLIEKGANIQTDNNCALWNALRYGHTETTEYLLTNCSDIDLDFGHEIKFLLNQRNYIVVEYSFERGIIYRSEKHVQINLAIRDKSIN